MHSYVRPDQSFPPSSSPKPSDFICSENNVEATTQFPFQAYSCHHYISSLSSAATIVLPAINLGRAVLKVDLGQTLKKSLSSHGEMRQHDGSRFSKVDFLDKNCGIASQASVTSSRVLGCWLQGFVVEGQSLRCGC
jgi:hypothetical protein